MDGIFSINHRNIFIWLGAIFIVAVIFFGYADPFAVLMAYFIESIFIGLFNFLKILLSNKRKNNGSQGSVTFKSFFFLVHYSFFIFVQSIFVFAMFSITDKNIKQPFNVFENFAYAFTINGFGLSIGIMVFVLLLELYFGYIKPKSYNHLSADDLFFKPYIRVIIQQFTVLIALFLVLITHLEIIAATVLILLRLLVDLTGVYITSNDSNMLRAAKFIKKNHTRSDIAAIEELKKYL